MVIILQGLKFIPHHNYSLTILVAKNDNNNQPKCITNINLIDKMTIEIVKEQCHLNGSNHDNACKCMYVYDDYLTRMGFRATGIRMDTLLKLYRQQFPF